MQKQQQMLIQDKVRLKSEKNMIPKLDFTNLHHNGQVYSGQGKKQPSPSHQQEKFVFQPRKKSTNVKKKSTPTVMSKQ
jgi:hypothetical protein